MVFQFFMTPSPSNGIDSDEEQDKDTLVSSCRVRRQQAGNNGNARKRKRKKQNGIGDDKHKDDVESTERNVRVEFGDGDTHSRLAMVRICLFCSPRLD